ncbi:MAG: hypothetical protein HOH65_09305 [Rhodospirillaceae bacterium]|nr:hypothetical protein [Rhodospirillaceae bacterium]
MNAEARLDHLPEALREPYRAAYATEEPLARFRAFLTLSQLVRAEETSLQPSIKEKRTEIESFEAERKFYKQHHEKVQEVLRSIRLTYVAPERAYTEFNDMCRDFSGEFVRQTLLLGAHRLGRSLGINFIIFRTRERAEADQNFEDDLRPKLLALANDHQRYLEYADTDFDARGVSMRRNMAELDGQVSTLAREVEAIQGDLRGAALAIPEEDKKKLSRDESIARRNVLAVSPRGGSAAAAPAPQNTPEPADGLETKTTAKTRATKAPQAPKKSIKDDGQVGQMINGVIIR